jgi:hypothetical protein
MGCDIHSRVQVLEEGQWKTVKACVFPPDAPDLFQLDSYWNRASVEPFSWRSYGMFGFLANVRNYSHIPAISEPRGLPEDIASSHNDDDYEFGDHSFSWLSLKELLEFDYDQAFEDRRCMRDGNGAADAGAGNGLKTTFREFLGPLFFRDLAILRCIRSNPEHVRVVFGFDN